MSNGPEKIALTRRDVLGTALGALFGVAGVIALDGKVEKSKDNLTTLEPHTYRDGETITVDDIRVTIEGWKLHFDFSKRVDFYEPQLSRKNLFDFKLIDSPAVNEPEVGTFRNTHTDGFDDDGKGMTVSALPPMQSEQLYLLYTKLDRSDHGDEIVRKNKLFPINLKYYPGIAYDGLISDFYEVDLGSKNAKELDKQRKAFSPFAPNHVLYVHDTTDNSYGITISDARQIHVNSIDFLQPVFPHNGLATVFHERCHMVRKGIQDGRNKYQHVYVELENAFEALADANRKDARVSENNSAPLFDVIRESYYFTPKHKRGSDKKPEKIIENFGHPQDNANEMFASAATVMRFFPEKFIQEYNALKGENKRAIQNAAHAILRAFHVIANNDKELVALFPQYKRLADTLGYTKAF